MFHRAVGIPQVSYASIFSLIDGLHILGNAGTAAMAARELGGQ